MDQKYPLYHTLTKNISSAVMRKTQEAQLKNKLDKLDENSCKAVLMIITEHSRVEDNQTFNTAKITIPYQGEQVGKDVKFDLANFPNKLKWVLWKFVNLEVASKK